MRWFIFVPPLAALVLGCAHSRQLDARSRAGDYVYEMPLPQLWPRVRDAVMAEGFAIREDTINWALETDWREEFSGSHVAALWRRYLVLADPLGPTRAKVRIFRVERTANETLEPEGAQILWGPRPDIGAQNPDLADPVERPTGSLQEWVERTERGDGSLRVEAQLASAIRDLELELRIVERVDPEGAAAIRAGRPLARRDLSSAQKVVLTSVAAPEIDCGTVIPSLSRVAAAGTLLVLGEMHGTNEVPRFVADAACQAAVSMAPVTVGLEVPLTEQARVLDYLNGPGGDEARQALLDGMFWIRPYQDGRSSRAMADLLERLRDLRARGLDVLVFLFDRPDLQFERREEALAQAIEREVRNHLERFVIVLSGNVHARATSGLPWAPKYVPMGVRLSKRLPRVLTLDLAYASGTAWICTVGSRLDCGVRPAKGPDNGIRPFIHLWPERDEHGFDGVYYVGAVSASPPAREIPRSSQ
jgi:hypothetical protein